MPIVHPTRGDQRGGAIEEHHVAPRAGLAVEDIPDQAGILGWRPPKEIRRQRALDTEVLGIELVIAELAVD